MWKRSEHLSKPWVEIKTSFRAETFSWLTQSVESEEDIPKDKKEMENCSMWKISEPAWAS